MTFKLVICSADSGFSGMSEDTLRHNDKDETLSEEQIKSIAHRLRFNKVQQDVSREVDAKLSMEKKKVSSTEDAELENRVDAIQPRQVEDKSMTDDSDDSGEKIDFSKDDNTNRLGLDFGERDYNSDEFVEEVESKRDVGANVLKPGAILLTKKGPLAIPEGQQIDFQKFDIENSDFGSFTVNNSKKFGAIFKDGNLLGNSEFLIHKQLEKEKQRKNHQKRKRKLIYTGCTSPPVLNTRSFSECPPILKKFKFKQNADNKSEPKAELASQVKATDTATVKDTQIGEGWTKV